MLWRHCLRHMASNSSINLKSVILDFAPANCLYSSNTESKHQFWNFRRLPTRQPVRCWKGKKKWISYMRSTITGKLDEFVIDTIRYYFFQKIHEVYWSFYKMGSNKSRFQPPLRFSQPSTIIFSASSLTVRYFFHSTDSKKTMDDSLFLLILVY